MFPWKGVKSLSTNMCAVQMGEAPVGAMGWFSRFVEHEGRGHVRGLPEGVEHREDEFLFFRVGSCVVTLSHSAFGHGC